MALQLRGSWLDPELRCFYACSLWVLQFPPKNMQVGGLATTNYPLGVNVYTDQA